MSVGIDIGSKTIKMVEIEGAKPTLKGAGVVGYAGNPIEYIKDNKEMIKIADVIRKLHRETKIGKKDVAISLPESLVYTRTVKFPLLTDQEVASAVKWEAEQYIPIPLAEALVQHEIIEKNESASPPSVLVLLVAVQQAVVEKYVRVINMAGLNAVLIETELMSMSRSLVTNEGASLLVDCGAKNTDIAITRNRKLVFSRSVPTAGEAATRAVAQNLGVELNQAEEYKKTYGLSDEKLEGKVKLALEPVIKLIADEIKKALHFYQSEEKFDPPKSLILSGGTAGMPEITAYLANYLEMEVAVANPFSNIAVSADVQKNLLNFAPLYPAAVGLALRE